MVEPVACCLHGIDMCAIHPGDTVMVIGAGTIGLIMLQLVRMSGATSIVVLETVAEKREIAKKLGTDIVIDPRSQDVEALLQSAGIGRIATTIECVGSRQTMLDAIHYAGKNSVAMLFGLTSPDTEILIRPFDIFKKEVSIKASFINPYTHSRAVEILKSGRIDINALISHTISLDDLSQVLADPTTRRNGKVIVDPWA
jgi:threonine dehydrogenase-like Zn-dependent dehydrogenase